jgi:hypothetical protein
VINNLTNLLNDEWGDFRQGATRLNVVDVELNDDGIYEYSNFGMPAENVDRDASLWEMRVGINYRF